MRYLPGIFALLTAAAGWYYLFYSGAVAKLGTVEAENDNRRRAMLRRAGGVAMLLLGAFFFAGFYSVKPESSPGMFLAVWLTVFGLLASVVLLALADLRITHKLRVKQRGPRL